MQGTIWLLDFLIGIWINPKKNKDKIRNGIGPKNTFKLLKIV